MPDAAAALQGARDILAERVAEDATVRAWVRDSTRSSGVLRANVASGKEKEVSKFQDYYDFSEKLGTLPSHRVLAIRRGEAEGFLVWTHRRAGRRDHRASRDGDRRAGRARASS